MVASAENFHSIKRAMRSDGKPLKITFEINGETEEIEVERVQLF